MTVHPAVNEVTELKAQAVRFEFDSDMRVRVQEESAGPEHPQTPIERLHAAMRTLRLRDETEVGEEAVSRAARKVAGLLGVSWETAGAPFQRCLMTCVRSVLGVAAKEGQK